MNGRLIVFEGTDGSGKATQSRLLCEHLHRENIPYKNITFPRYGKPSAAMVQEYLDGNLGRRPGDVNAYAASLMFSMDRYTTSNAVHQASKLLPGERKAFLDWLFDTEYRLLGLPKPDLVIYLDMPTEITEKMMRRRETATGTHADIHEQDETYLKNCRAAAQEIVKDCGWTVIRCARDGDPRTVEDIHNQVYRTVRKLL